MREELCLDCDRTGTGSGNQCVIMRERTRIKEYPRNAIVRKKIRILFKNFVSFARE